MFNLSNLLPVILSGVMFFSGLGGTMPQVSTQTVQNGTSVATYSVVQLPDSVRSKHPELASAGNSLNAAEKKDAEEYVADNANGPKDNPYTSKSSIQVLRSDDQILSAVRKTEYNGGAHPAVLYSGVNLDPNTGYALTAKDVLQNPNALARKVADSVISQNPTMAFDRQQLEDGVKAAFKDGSLAFAIDDDTLHVYVDENVTGAHVYGTYEVKIPLAGSGVVKDAHVADK